MDDEEANEVDDEEEAKGFEKMVDEPEVGANVGLVF